MPSRTLSVAVKSDEQIVQCKRHWRKQDDLDFDVTLPPTDSLIVRLDTNFGDIEVDDALEICEQCEASTGSSRTFRWSPAALKAENGSATITIANWRQGYEDVEIEVSMGRKATVENDEDGPEEETAEDSMGSVIRNAIGENIGSVLSLDFHSLELDDLIKRLNKYRTGIDLVDRYAAYGIGLLAALFVLIVAQFMPAHQTVLLSAAGSLAVATFCFSNLNDNFLPRTIGLVAAGAVLLAAFFVPQYAGALIGASGSIATASFWMTAD